MGDEIAPKPPRHIGFLLMAGLLMAPLLFAWVLLLPRYPGSTRIAAFTYALVPLALGLVVSALS